MKFPMLGNIPVKQFLEEYWQKKPLLVRNAVSDFNGFLTPQEVLSLACREDVESRLVTQSRSKWKLEHGPFSHKKFESLPKKSWTILIQDLNHYISIANEFLKKFSFIPYARLDDLMVSYAVPGGGVGPHFDSYDVFLIQGKGERRWRISAQKNLELVPDFPLKILKRFEPENEWVLGPGDMLYLPPQYAHEGVALTECITYSVGFRASSYQELIENFLMHLQDNCRAEGMYSDPDLAPVRHPAEISPYMLTKVSSILESVKWDEDVIAHFLGIYLSEPKPHVYFNGPSRPLSLQKFAAKIAKGIKLSLKSRMLYQNHTFYLNGEFFKPSKKSVKTLQLLADEGFVIPGANMEEKTLETLWEWYRAGYLEI